MLLAALADTVKKGAAAGDFEAVRIAHDAIGKLLGAPVHSPAEVVDLRAERDRRS